MTLGSIKTYGIFVEGYGHHSYSARSPGKARAAAFRDFGVCSDIDFRGFLKISRCVRVADPPGVGRRIKVAGEEATTVIGYGQYVHYMRDDSDAIICSHPLDVTYLDGAPAMVGDAGGTAT